MRLNARFATASMFARFFVWIEFFFLFFAASSGVNAIKMAITIAICFMFCLLCFLVTQAFLNGI
jgi:hypothetical protein